MAASLLPPIKGEFTVKKFALRPQQLALVPMNPTSSTIYPNPDDLDVFGLVLNVIHPMPE
jgi:DNA polymerase V